MRSIVLQAGNKFIYSQVSEEQSNEAIKESLSLLSLAGIVMPVTHTSANGIPLGAEINPRYRKYLFLDTGLMQTMLGMQAADILISNETDFVNKGGLSEMFAGLEILKYSDFLIRQELYYWQRMARNAQAKVDYVVNIQGRIIPIEVKSSTSGSMQSLYKFMELKHSGYGIRVSLEPFAMYNNIKVIPLYALSSIRNNSGEDTLYNS